MDYIKKNVDYLKKLKFYNSSAKKKLKDNVDFVKKIDLNDVEEIPENYMYSDYDLLITSLNRENDNYKLERDSIPKEVLIKKGDTYVVATKEEQLDSYGKKYDFIYNYSQENQKKINLLNSKIVQNDYLIRNAEQLKKEANYAVFFNSDDYKKFDVSSVRGGLDNQSVNVGPVYDSSCNVSPLEFVLDYRKNGFLSNVTGLEYEKLLSLIEASEITNNNDLLKLYNYLYGTKGIDAANNYLDDMYEKCNNIIGYNNAQKLIDSLDDKSDEEINAEILKHLNVGKKGFSESISSFFEGFSGYGSEGDYTILDYEKLYIIANLPKKYKSSYDFGSYLGTQTLDTAMNVVVPGSSTVFNTISNGGNSYKSSMQDGDDSNATLNSIKTMTVSAIVDKAFKEYVPSGTGALKNVASETIEGNVESVFIKPTLFVLNKTESKFVGNIKNDVKENLNNGIESAVDYVDDSSS